MRPDDTGGAPVDWSDSIRTLVPGEPEDVISLAQILLRWSVICSNTVTGLNNIDPDWSGAARAAYEVKKAAHLDQWTKVSSAFDSAGGALLSYARALANAQADAAVAKQLGLKDTVHEPTAGPATSILVSAQADVDGAAVKAIGLLEDATSLLPKVEEFEGLTGGLSTKDWVVGLTSPWGAAVVFGPRVVDKAPEIGRGIYDLTRPGSNDTKTDFSAGLLRGLVDLGLMSAKGIDQTNLSNQLDYLERSLGINPDSGAHGTGVFLGPMLIPIPGAGGLGELGAVGGRAAQELAAEAALRRAIAEAKALGTSDDLLTVLKGKGVNSVWLKEPRVRGLEIEDQAGGNLPATFPTFDRFDDGVATSIKSIDLTAPSYANTPGQITSTLNRYVDQVASYTSGTRKGVTVTAEDIDRRVLEIYVQEGKASAAQTQALDATIAYAKKRGIDIEVRHIP